MDILLLLCAGLLGGAVNSLAGGGSFIVFPALLAAGVPPVMANATNTFSALPGYITGAVAYWRDISKHKQKLALYVIVALVGGYLGAELLLVIDDAQFSQIVPWLMALAVVLFAFGARINQTIGAWVGGAGPKQRFTAFAGMAGLTLLLLAICIYGGFFNAGLGIILLAFFALAGFTDIHAMNGLKLLLSALVAAIAVARFVMSDSIAWYEGIAAFVGTLIGGYIAARLAHAVSRDLIRHGVIIYGIGITLIFFWQAYA